MINKPGRKLLKEDQIRNLCIQCNKNKQAPAPLSSLGYKRYTPLCSPCNKKKYNISKKTYQQNKKPHCERCGFLAIHKCQLDVHHKDHNHKNNNDNNLETLCANCHRLYHFNII